MRRLAVNQAERSTPNAQLRKVREQAFSPRRSIGTSEIKREQLDALPFARVRIEDNAIFRFAVLGRRFRIQHLERIASRLEGPRKHAFSILALDRGCLWSWARLTPTGARSKSGSGLFPRCLRNCNGITRKHDQDTKY